MIITEQFHYKWKYYVQPSSDLAANGRNLTLDPKTFIKGKSHISALESL